MAKKNGKPLTVTERRRRRADNALTVPPPAVRITTDPGELQLTYGGRVYPIGGAIEGDVVVEMTTDQAATVTIPIRDTDDLVLGLLVDREGLSRDGLRTTVDGAVYTLSTWQSDDGLVSLVLEDDVAWRLRQQRKRVVANRGQVTRAGFVRRLVEEAGKPPAAPIPAFIPEVLDKQPVAKAT